ncbi:phosphomethylpyrimidine synthase ThiC [candidate division KSB1 bacterium]|nr:phosphomethylpyrimidine synthase ThiC [candidate division KSB1 bacterium]
MTLITQARKNNIPQALKIVAADEGVNVDFIVEKLQSGEIVIPANPRHSLLHPVGIGSGLRTKINANIGTSPTESAVDNELAKLKICVDNKADAVMDLSTGGDLDTIRQAIIAASPLPVGTVPIYDVMVNSKSITDVDADKIFSTIRRHGEQGVDFITVHCGVTKDLVPLIESRVGGVVSRGGSFLAAWMKRTGKENPLYEQFDRLLDIAYEYDMTLSLGDGLRPGAIADASDTAQLSELSTLGELTERARARDVQVMIEGPGHVPLHLIRENMEIQQKRCKNAPFYVLGPIVTDVAPGYDHITSAIGGALAAWYGAAFLCYVTPAEHLRLPSLQDVKDGIIASRIAAHAADIARNLPGAAQWDLNMSQKRKALDWEGMLGLAMDPEKARKYREDSNLPDSPEACSMCGDFCAVKICRETV